MQRVSLAAVEPGAGAVLLRFEIDLTGTHGATHHAHGHELWGALSQRGKDRFRFRRVDDQSSSEQANGEETTDGMEPAWSTSPPTDKNPRARRGVGEHLPALVSVFPPSSASQESGLTPENLPLSIGSHPRRLPTTPR